MGSPLKAPKGDWWSIPIHGQEKTWLGIAALLCLVLFGWMWGWMYLGSQNPTGPTYRVEREVFERRVADYRAAGTQTELGFVPPGDDIYVAGIQFAWDGLPVVLERGREYRLHLGAYDVQHGFSVRPEAALWKQMNLQAIPGYEWIIDIRFDEVGTYQVVCNEFCGLGHRLMRGEFQVVEDVEDVVEDEDEEDEEVEADEEDEEEADEEEDDDAD